MKKKILFISPNFNLACGVSKHIYTLLTSDKLNSEFDLFYITNGGDALPKLNKAGVNYKIESFKTNSILHFDILKNLRWLKEYCDQKQINIIHTHHRYPEYLSNLVKKSLGIRTVITAHNFTSGLKYISYQSDCVIAINNSVKEHLLKSFRLNAERIEVLYNCVKNENNINISKKRIRQSLSISEDHAVILYLGRIIKEKGIDLLCNAFKLLSKNNNNIVLLIVGSGDFSYNEFKDVAANKIKIFASTEQIQKFYAIADVVVLPSQREPFGYIMLEAGLNKIPFIGSRTGGIAEFVEDGVDGFLFESGNSNDLAAKIEFVLDNPETAHIASLKLNEKVVRLCNCNDYFQKLSDIYQKLLVE